MKTERNRTAGDDNRGTPADHVPGRHRYEDSDQRPAEPGRSGRAGDRPGQDPVPQTRPKSGPSADVISPAGTPVAWRTAEGWRVGDEEVSDLTSAMVLADLLAADLPASAPPAPAPARSPEPVTESPDTRKLQETVAQLEHALRVRVRVEQAIGVLAERHRLRPRQAFELLRSAARVRGRRVLEVAGEVVDSATNPLLRIPEELAKPPVTRRRGRLTRHSFNE